LALTAATHPGRDDSSYYTVPDPDPIGIDHGEPNALNVPEGDRSAFPVVPATVFTLQGWTVEYARRKLEIKTTIPKVARTLSRVPTEAHLDTIRLYIHSGNRRLPG
jgi:hypothetical protein